MTRKFSLAAAPFLVISAAAPAHSTSYIYVAAGLDPSSITSAVYYAQVQVGGSLTAWTSTTTFPIYTKELCGAAFDNVIYAGSGTNGTGAPYYTDMYASTASASGGIGGWTSVTALPTGYYQPILLPDPAGSFLYLCGGYGPSGPAPDTWTVSATGTTVGAWSASTPIPTGMEEHSACQVGGYAFVYNAWGGAGSATGVWSAPIGGGTIGGWTAQAIPPLAGYASALVACGGYLYAIGGTSPAGSAVYVTTPTGGALASWTSTTALPAAFSEHSALAVDGYVYVLGHAASSAAVYSAPVLSGGGLGAWTAATNLPTGLQEEVAVPVCFDSQGTPIPCSCIVPATNTPIVSPTPTATATVSPTPTASGSPTQTGSPSQTASPSATGTPSGSATQTGTVSPTATISLTPCPTLTPNPTGTRTFTTTAPPSATPSPTSSVTPPPSLPTAPPFLIVDRNAFNPSTDRLGVLFALAEDANVRIAVFNSAGEFVANLWNGPVQARLPYAVLWRGENDAGSAVASNVYVIRLLSNRVSLTAKVAVVR